MHRQSVGISLIYARRPISRPKPPPARRPVVEPRWSKNLKNPYDSVAPTALSEELAQAVKPLVVDVRPAPEQFADVHIPGSINIPQSDLAARAASSLPQDRSSPIVMVCGISRDFPEMRRFISKSMGYRHVRSMKGSINEWVRKKTSRSEPQAAKKPV